MFKSDQNKSYFIQESEPRFSFRGPWIPRAETVCRRCVSRFGTYHAITALNLAVDPRRLSTAPAAATSATGRTNLKQDFFRMRRFSSPPRQLRSSLSQAWRSRPIDIRRAHPRHVLFRPLSLLVINGPAPACRPASTPPRTRLISSTSLSHRPSYMLCPCPHPQRVVLRRGYHLFQQQAQMKHYLSNRSAATIAELPSIKKSSTIINVRLM